MQPRYCWAWVPLRSNGSPSAGPFISRWGGASLGVAYLTSYSAYGHFGLVDDVQALGALFVVACAATAFALRSRALSIALLAMLGAFLAPAFALRDPGPVGVYGYYVAASTLALIMVWRRGWRAIAHLSFPFTLAGGVFFAWTQKFYTPQHYAQMHPLVLALIALHVAMPLLEQPPSPSDEAHGPWGRRFDTGHFLLLPLSAGALTMLLAPAGTRLGSLDLLELSGVWLAAAGIQRHPMAKARSATWWWLRCSPRSRCCGHWTTRHTCSWPRSWPVPRSPGAPRWGYRKAPMICS